MKVLLWRDIDKLGRRGEVVEVRSGYARNHLLPRRMASLPTPSMYREFELEKRRQVKQEQRLVSDAEHLAVKISQLTSVTIEVNTNTEGHLYGSVTPTMVAEALRDQGLKVEPRAIEIESAIKQIGIYEVTVNLFKEVKPKLKIWVVSTKAVSEASPTAPSAGEPASA